MTIITEPHQDELTIKQLEAQVAELSLELEKLQKTGERKDSVAYWSHELIVFFNESNQCIEANEKTTRMFGYSREELIGMHALNVIAPESKNIVAHNMSNHYAEPYEAWFVRKDGTRFLGLTRGHSTTYQGQPVRITTVRDITKEKEEQAALTRAQEMETIFNNGLFAMGVFSSGRMIHQINDKALEILGYSSADELVGKSIRTLHLSDEAYTEFGSIYANSVINRDVKALECQFRCKDGSPIWVKLSTKALDTNNPPDPNKGSVWIAADISDEKSYKDNLIKLATTDSLTGIHNRRSFVETCKQELSRQQRYGHPLSLLMLDIDHFKKINDTYGHDVGDEALQFFTKTCESHLRETDCFGRLGGEEFAILLPETDIGGALKLAERICKLTELLSSSQSSPIIPMTVSIGVTSSLDGNESISSFLKRADKGLYKAKECGRNRVETVFLDVCPEVV